MFHPLLLREASSRFGGPVSPVLLAGLRPAERKEGVCCRHGSTLPPLERPACGSRADRACSAMQENQKALFPSISLYGKFAVTHDDTTIYSDGAASWDDIHVDGCVPISPRKLGIRIAKGDVQTRHFFVLQEIARKFFEAGERTDGKFTGTIAVGDREQVVAQFIRHPGI